MIKSIASKTSQPLVGAVREVDEADPQVPLEKVEVEALLEVVEAEALRVEVAFRKRV